MKLFKKFTGLSNPMALGLSETMSAKKGDDPGKFRQLEEIIFINGYPGYQYLFSIAEKSMQVVCDIKEIGSTKFFRLNDSKVLAWLNYKFASLQCTSNPTLVLHFSIVAVNLWTPSQVAMQTFRELLPGVMENGHLHL
ncbi:hypothetical protein TEA_024288 [Camellia sinensis var. sinensis]|uniref:Ribonuclease H2 subunit B wHTH domain-containing protein n=1 Tax=Camellia sinensis var. sinensis TaxID=542762 RepID=A0A4S4EY01_CAMSN|nr:hypothetical protein TEA_024288 [Camellia sinensis var. sinensis]